MVGTCIAHIDGLEDEVSWFMPIIALSVIDSHLAQYHRLAVVGSQ